MLLVALATLLTTASRVPCNILFLFRLVKIWIYFLYIFYCFYLLFVVCVCSVHAKSPSPLVKSSWSYSTKMRFLVVRELATVFQWCIYVLTYSDASQFSYSNSDCTLYSKSWMGGGFWKNWVRGSRCLSVRHPQCSVLLGTIMGAIIRAIMGTIVRTIIYYNTYYYTYYYTTLTFGNDHTIMTTPLPVCSAKLSMLRLS